MRAQWPFNAQWLLSALNSLRAGFRAIRDALKTIYDIELRVSSLGDNGVNVIFLELQHSFTLYFGNSRLFVTIP